MSQKRCLVCMNRSEMTASTVTVTVLKHLLHKTVCSEFLGELFTIYIHGRNTHVSVHMIYHNGCKVFTPLQQTFSVHTTTMPHQDEHARKGIVVVYLILLHYFFKNVVLEQHQHTGVGPSITVISFGKRCWMSSPNCCFSNRSTTKPTQIKVMVIIDV